jgi:cell division protein ZapE
MDLTPPARFDEATFDAFRPGTPSQGEALKAARQFAESLARPRSLTERLRALVGRPARRHPDGLYLVGPVGTGKTHLLASVYHALTPDVPCAFLHSSTLFRMTGSLADFAARLADRVAVCCLDEVEIDDPANEVRLVHVLKTLEENGVALLATSNVEPEAFLSNKFGPNRFRRFLEDEFRSRYRVLFVDGDDHRRAAGEERPGRGWVGPPASTRPALKAAYNRHGDPKRWMEFDDLLRAATETAHDPLVDALTSLDALFVAGIAIRDTDDALRLLRIIDDLYVEPDAPALFFTSETPPERWFDPDAHAGVAGAVAEKFTRTVSRLHALCDVGRPAEPEDA